MMKYRSAAITIAVILLSTFLFTKCVSNKDDKAGDGLKTKYKDFAGSASCMNCHKGIYENHIRTGHFHTTAIANDSNIAGSFDTGKNKVAFSTGGEIRMEKRSGGYYQVAYNKGKELKCERFDIVVGIGTQGQSYASWGDHKLVQLPITYFTGAAQWSNSPGYPNKIAFNRPITSRCLECHATFAEKLSAEDVEPEDFDKTKMILGVDCEKCHGPAAKHVEYQTQNPNAKKAMYIINPASFSRQQSLDMCAMCHGGRLEKTKPSFSFTAGDKLADFFVIDTAAKDVNNIDVHGNQYGLLVASKCFKMSKTLTCLTCHDAHNNEKDSVALFSQRCMSCHNNKHVDGVVCKMTTSLGNEIGKNCVGCHMPALPSMAIAVILPGQQTPTSALMHTHLIKNYPDETKRMLALFKEKK